MAFQMLAGFSARQKRILEVAWVAGTRGTRPLSGRKIVELDIPSICKEIMKYMNDGSYQPREHFSLRLCVILTNGVARIHLKRINQLIEEFFYLLHTRWMKSQHEDFLIETPIAVVKRKKGRKKIVETPEEDDDDDESRGRGITMIEDDSLLVANVDEEMDSFGVLTPEMQESMLTMWERRDLNNSSIELPPHTEVVEVMVHASAGSLPMEETQPGVEPMVIEELPSEAAQQAARKRRVEEVDEPAVEPKRQREDSASVESVVVVVRKRKREDSCNTYRWLKVPKSVVVNSNMNAKINVPFRQITENILQNFTKPDCIDNDLFQDDYYRQVEITTRFQRPSVVRHTDGAKSPTAEQINLPERHTPELIEDVSTLPPDVPAVLPEVPTAPSDAPTDLSDVPSDLSAAPTVLSGSRNGIGSGSDRGSCAMDLTCGSEHGSTASKGSKISLQTIISKISVWNLDEKPVTIEDLCDKPFTKLKMARMFSNLLALSKQQIVVLKTEQNGLELASIAKGPKFPCGP